MASGSVSVSIAAIHKEALAASASAVASNSRTTRAASKRQKRCTDADTDAAAGGEFAVLSRHRIGLVVEKGPAGCFAGYAGGGGGEVPVVVDLRVPDGEDVDMDSDAGSARAARLSVSSAGDGAELMALDLDPSTLPEPFRRDITWASKIRSHFSTAARPFASACTLAFQSRDALTLTLTLTARCRNAFTPETIALVGTDPWWRLLAEAFPAHAPAVDNAQPVTPKDFYAACHTPARAQAVPAETVQRPALQCTLLPYQRRTVKWMLDRESAVVPEGQQQQPPPTFSRERDADGADCYVSHVFGIVSRDLAALWRATELPRGGLLAEEMGLGKTVEMIALMALHPMPAAATATAGGDGRSIGATLIITPPSILEQWKTEIAAHAPSVRVCHYRGMKQHLGRSTEDLVAEFRGADVVLTTYAVLSQELHYLAAKDWSRRLSKTKRYEARRSPLGELTWWRVCVDEAQMIDGGLSNAAVVARQIRRVNAWAVTGTPLRKDINDLHGLLRFLRYEPFDERGSGGGAATALFGTLARYNHGAFRAVVGAVALRHTKDAVGDEIRLPLQKRVVVRVPFSAIEEQNYRHLFQQMCDECRIADGAAEDELQPEVVERLRVWLTRLRQTCLHPQAGERNRRVFGGTKAPLRTVDEVLDLMADAHAVAVRNDERALFESKIRRGQMLEIQGEYGAALAVWTGVLADVREVVRECRAALDAEPKTRPQEPAVVEEPAEWQEEEEEGGDEQDGRADVGGRHGTLRNRLRNILELEHACLFWVGTAWYRLKEEKEKADPKSEELPQLRANEEEHYEAAKLVRKEMMQETRSRALKLLAALRARATAHRFAAIPAIPAPNPNCGIEAQSALYDLTELATTLNAQASLIGQWRAQLLALLAKPILDEDEDSAPDRGNEFEVSVSDQELGERLMTGLRVLLADRAEALAGEERSALIRHDVQADLARRGIHQAFFAEMMQRREACRVKGGCLKRGVAELRAKAAGWRGAGGGGGGGARVGGARVEMQRVLVEEEVGVFAEVLARQVDVNREIANEIVFFRNVTNARKEFYSQIQAISDTVEPLDPEVFFWKGVQINDALFQKLLNEERILAEKVTKAKSKLRYLVHLKGKGVEEEQECLICKETYEIGILTSCGHSYCKECMVEWYKTSHKCPACTATLSLKDMYQISYRPKEATMQEERALPSSSSDPASPSIYSGMDKRIMDEIKRIEIKQHYGSKIDMIIRHLHWLRQHEPHFKAVLFSQWGDFLEFMQTVLTHSRLGFATLGHGGGGVKAFQAEPGCHIFLLHAKSQSAGLSLVGATHVVLCEPLLNVSLELQAISRVHRIGQRRPTTVWLYVVEGTVEESVWALATRRRLQLMRQCGEEGAAAAAESSGSSSSSDEEMGESPVSSQGEEGGVGEGEGQSQAERRLQLANSVEMQKGMGGMVERGVGGGEVVGCGDVWECVFGGGRAGHKRQAEDVVRREMLAGAAEGRLRAGVGA